MTAAALPTIQSEERPPIRLSPETRWKRALAMTVACLLALVVHGLIVFVLVAEFALFTEESQEEASLEEQVIAVVQLPPPPPAQPAPEENQIDVGRVNQGQDSGGGEAEATGELDPVEAPPQGPEPAPEVAEAPPEPEPPQPEPAPPPVEQAEPPPEPPQTQVAEAPSVEEPPQPEPPQPEVAETPSVEEIPLPQPAEEARVEEAKVEEARVEEPSVEEPPPEPEPQTEVPPPFPAVPLTDLPELALTERPSEPQDDAEIEKLNLDSNLTEVLVTAALDREAEVSGPNAPMAVPPSKPEREVTLPPVPRPVRTERQTTARKEVAETRQNRKASNEGEASGDGGGYGGGSETNYLGLVARQLNQQKIYPQQSLVQGEEGTVVVRFTVDEEGWVIARRILRSSGFRRLDDEVMDLLIRASPLPPPPGRPEKLTMTVTLRFYSS